MLTFFHLVLLKKLCLASLKHTESQDERIVPEKDVLILTARKCNLIGQINLQSILEI